MGKIKYVLIILLAILVYTLGSTPKKTMQLTNLDYKNFPLRVDSSSLVVNSLAKTKSFYADIGDVPLTLTEEPSATPASSSSAGLYHNAFVFQDGAALAQVLSTLLQKYPSSFDGSANHTVSLAFYFHDPEGSGFILLLAFQASSAYPFPVFSAISFAAFFWAACPAWLRPRS